MIPLFGFAQHLNKPVTLSAKGQPVSRVLKTLEEQGHFYFSYNSDLIPGDSIVQVNLAGKPVSEVLNQLFRSKYQYKEKGDYIIILAAPKERTFYIDGFVTDQENNIPVDFASIYSRQLLASTLSEDDGHFRLRIRDKNFPVNITISKVGYADTTVIVQNLEETRLKISLYQKAVDLDPLIVRYSEGESTWLGRLFVSAKLRAQSRNISKFFVSLPYQASLTPGLGTHGRMSSQVVNRFSLNLLGGYTAGVNGLEIAGGFNISKQDVRYVQVAGIFNIVSGHVNGVQLAGLHNEVLDSLKGVQVSGFSGFVEKKTSGVQISGFMNRSAGPLDGVQVSGALNFAKETSGGGQIAGGYNQARKDFDGFQVSSGINIVGAKLSGMQLGFVNYAKELHGIQLGIVNIADSSSGVSLGLINIIRKSTSNLTVSASEVAPFNVSWKMGTHKFYGILTGGVSTGGSHSTYVFGAGIGREFFPFKKWGFFTEITSGNIFQGSWENMRSLFRLETAATYKLNKRLLVFAGPSYSICQNQASLKREGYKSFPIENYPNIRLGDKLGSWFGWQVGMSWRYGQL
ncbi:hypothetical protein FEN17_09295 [Dyadobacter luticola]|uniref:Carboxypeptidase-like regulatory domain-containing protein n=1 Tax=Dyadobacter luticola TaxID=1979387 RepID=A0A5R9L705_9BACT|nr:hypothetical protein FEN17_09295 [Dyadobacter luticola]